MNRMTITVHFNNLENITTNSSGSQEAEAENIDPFGNSHRKRYKTDILLLQAANKCDCDIIPMCRYFL